jgi:hypothetical protein
MLLLLLECCNNTHSPCLCNVNPQVVFQKKDAHTALGYTAKPGIDT